MWAIWERVESTIEGGGSGLIARAVNHNLAFAASTFNDVSLHAAIITV
jgi:hypothetical protein